MRWMLRWGTVLALMVIIIQVTTGSPSAQESAPAPENVFQRDLGNIRNDIELLADRVFPLAERPEGWNGSTDVTSDSALADLFIDNELLADEIFEGERPDDWISASSNVADLIARNIRHDLEISADTWIGEDLRPDDWVGGPLLFRCSQSLMNIIYILEVAYGVSASTPEGVFNYCASLSSEADEILVPSVLQRQQVDDLSGSILAVRGDLERLADEVLGLDNRPGGWVDNTDITSETFVNDLTADLELLADVILDGRRPESWVTIIPAELESASRTLRFNLELLTDIALGDNARPNGWQGETQLTRCAPDVQNVAALAANVYPYEIPTANITGRDYCALVEASANFAIENPPPPEVLEDIAADERAIQFTAESRNAFAYDDAAATTYYGVLPWGTQFRAWYRNFNGSTMMFVSGDNFAMFIDRRWTTLSQEVFDTLPTLEGVLPRTFCDANWCNGPAPTPTPTGSGPLLDIIFSGTQPVEAAPIGTADGDTEGLQLVTWNNIRVNYLLFREDLGQVQVTLEICRDASQVVCEPVISVFDSQTSTGVPIVSQSGGLNVYQLPFGYSTRFTIEGQTLYSEDIWLNDPTLTNAGQ